MSRNLIAIAFSDLHIHNWKQHNGDGGRIYHHLGVLSVVRKAARKKGVPLLFGGDFAHSDKHLSNKWLSIVLPFLKKKFNKVPFYGISGNHDQSESMTYSHYSPNYVHTFSQIFKDIHCIDFKTTELRDFVIHGIPYLKYNIGFDQALKDRVKDRSSTKKNILVIHTDLHGAKDTDGRVIGSVDNIPEDMDKYFRKFDLVLCGHIHSPQQLGENLLMLGAPLQQRKTDMGSSLGYWEIYSDMSYEFVKIKKTPKFKYYNEGDKINDFHYWIKVEEFELEEEEEEVSFGKKTSKTKLATRYLKKQGIQDKDKKKVLIDVLKRTQ